MRFTLAIEILTSELDAAFVRFRSGVAEERLVEARDFQELPAESDLRVVRVKVANVVEMVQLFDDRSLDVCILVTETVHGDARDEVQILVTFVIKQIRAFTLHKIDIDLAVKRSNGRLILFQKISEGLFHNSILPEFVSQTYPHPSSRECGFHRVRA